MSKGIFQGFFIVEKSNNTGPQETKLIDASNPTLTLQVGGTANNFSIQIEGKMDREFFSKETDFHPISLINISGFSTSLEINKKGIYTLATEGISSIRANILSSDGEISIYAGSIQ